MSEREDYRAKIETLVANWNIEFEALDDRISTTGGNSMGDYDEVIMELRQYRNQASINR